MNVAPASLPAQKNLSRLMNAIVNNDASEVARLLASAPSLAAESLIGHPSSRAWNPKGQAEIISLLIKAGEDPNAVDKSGVAPLHRSVRQRCASAVDSLLRNGASVRLKNKSGSPLHLAVQNAGKGGSGLHEAKALQREIIELLLKANANPNDRDGRGKTVRQAAQSNWISVLNLSMERN